MDNDLDRKIQKAIDALGPELKPGVIHVSFKHDDKCPALRTHRLTDCTCDPDVEKMFSC